MIENPRTLSMTQEIYEKAKIEREFVIAPNKLLFYIVDKPEVLGIIVEIKVTDHMFDSMFLEKELTAYLMASDPELADWNRKHHLSYLKDEMKYFIATEEFTDGNNSVIFHWLTKAKSINGIGDIYDKGNGYKFHTAHEIPKAHFDILAKYLTIV